MGVQVHGKDSNIKKQTNMGKELYDIIYFWN